MKVSLSIGGLTWNMVRSRLMATLKADKQLEQHQHTLLTYAGYKSKDDLDKVLDLLRELPDHKIVEGRPATVEDAFPNSGFQVYGARFQLVSPEEDVLCMLQYWSFTSKKDPSALKSYIMSLKA